MEDPEKMHEVMDAFQGKMVELGHGDHEMEQKAYDTHKKLKRFLVDETVEDIEEHLTNRVDGIPPPPVKQRFKP
jgi:cobalamin-dependent methionine synthase I